MNTGTKLLLTGKSAHGRHIIKKCGPQWIVYAVTDKILFNPVTGPWLYIAPIGKPFQDLSSIWIQENEDLNFTWSFLGE
jgi:hypothetical protein